MIASSTLFIVCAFLALATAQKWQLFTDGAGETRFRLRAGNNEPVLASEGYSAKSGAVAGIAACKMQAKDKANFELRNSTNGKPYFVLKSANSQVIGTSELYESMMGATDGITAVMTAAAAAETISDQTVTSANGASGQFQVFFDGAGDYRFRLLAGNGEPILSSEGYKSKSGCLNGIDSVRENVAQLSSFDLKESTGAKVQYYFNIKANNGQVIGTSELYTTSGARAVGQFSVIRIAPDAAVVDLTLGMIPERVGRFEIFESIQGNFRFTLKAKNYQVILTSESYTTKAAAMNGIDSIKTNAPMAARYQNNTAANGQFYFNLRAGNNQVIGSSELYTTEAARANGIQSVMSTAPTAEIIDRTIDNRFVSKFEIFCDDTTGSFYFRLRSPNGQSLIVSSAYATSKAASSAIGIVKALAPIDARYTKIDSPPSFTISPLNATAIAFSDSYASTAARDAGIESVKGGASNAIAIEIPCVTKQATVATTTVVTKAGETTVPVTPPPESQPTTAPTFTVPVDPSAFTEAPATTTVTYATFTIPIDDKFTVITTTTPTETFTDAPGSTTTTGKTGPASSSSSQLFATLFGLVVVVVALI